MTKKEMIQTIRVAEARAWGEFREAQKTFGAGDNFTQRLRVQWAMVYELMESLGIETLTTAELLQQGLYAL